MHSIYRIAAILLSALLLSACPSLTREFQMPQVSVTSFGIAPESKRSPVFNIGLRVVNPNRIALPLKGMSYVVEIEGNTILSGATSDLPGVGAYDTADLVVQASPDLFGSIKLLNQLFNSRKKHFDYKLKAQLDIGKLLPLIHIEEKGQFNYAGD